MATHINGESGKSISVGLKEGLAEFWITSRTTGWSILVPTESFRDGLRSAQYRGHSEAGCDRYLTLQQRGGQMRVRIHHPNGRSGLAITVSVEELEQAVTVLLP
jgi:hypothetical protein